MHELAGGRLTPVDPAYDVAARVRGPILPETQTVSGILILDAAPQSMASRAVQQILRVLVREAGA